MTVLRAVGARFTWRRLPGGLNRLSEIGVSPSDSEELSVRKAVLVLSSTLMATLSFVWVATYAALGLWLSAAIPFAALQTFLAATQAFRYVEDRWVQLITQPHPVDAGTPAAQHRPRTQPRPKPW